MKIKIGHGIMIEVAAELAVKIQKVLAVLKDTHKIELEYDKYLIRCWTVDHGSGKKVLSIQIEEVL